MPALAAVTVFAIDGEVANDDAAPDAGAERQKHDAVIDLSTADTEFTIRGCVGVVGVGDR